MPTFEARIIHVSINRPWNVVSAFVMAPQNMPKWAAGLARGLERRGDHWVADGGPLGEIEIFFAPENAFGVADHDIKLPDGTVFQNALRVVPNGDGAEVMFTLLRTPGMSDDDFKSDAGLIEKDFATLKAILEGTASPA